MEAKLNRNAILAASIVASLLLHVGLLVASPRVHFGASELPAYLKSGLLSVRLLDEAELPYFDDAPGPPGTATGSPQRGRGLPGETAVSRA